MHRSRYAPSPGRHSCNKWTGPVASVLDLLVIFGGVGLGILVLAAIDSSLLAALGWSALCNPKDLFLYW